MTVTRSPVSSANRVVAAALDLFAEHGFEQTSVEQIAKAAGVSRSTFFRQFGGKDDVIFADHEHLLIELRAFLDAGHQDPWSAVCEGATTVFQYFAAHPDVARRRYEIVRQFPSLREREIVAVFRYERLFDEYLRSAIPGIDPLDSVSFAAAVTAVHNHVLRRLLRSTKRVPVSELIAGLDAVRHRFGVSSQQTTPAVDDVVVAVFPRSMPSAEVARRVREQLS